MPHFELVPIAEALERVKAPEQRRPAEAQEERPAVTAPGPVTKEPAAEKPAAPRAEEPPARQPAGRVQPKYVTDIPRLPPLSDHRRRFRGR